MYKLPLFNTNDYWSVYGSELSPFTLKVLNYLSFYQIPHKFYPVQGSAWQNIRVQMNKTLLVTGLRKLTWPVMSKEDEFPLVPFLFGPNGETLYDSSAIAEWLEECSSLNVSRTLFPSKVNEPKLHFLQHLVDEFFDDWGLYLVHHNRWKVSCLDNDAGKRLGKELSHLMGPIGAFADRFFSNRQNRRLPYLFSVAPANFHVSGAKRQPPGYRDFPATHDLLENSFTRILEAIEPIFSTRPFLFGESYTLADASLYGQLAMNLADPSAAKLIANKAPNTFEWLNRLASLSFTAHRDDHIKWHDNLKPLFEEISRTFLPLMDQNERAFELYQKQGQRLFNEKAFWKGQAIYEGEIDGCKFKSVAKSFQVSTWRVLKQQYQALNKEDKTFIQSIMPNTDLMT